MTAATVAGRMPPASATGPGRLASMEGTDSRSRGRGCDRSRRGVLSRHAPLVSRGSPEPWCAQDSRSGLTFGIGRCCVKAARGWGLWRTHPAARHFTRLSTALSHPVGNASRTSPPPASRRSAQRSHIALAGLFMRGCLLLVLHRRTIAPCPPPAPPAPLPPAPVRVASCRLNIARLQCVVDLHNGHQASQREACRDAP